MPPSASFALCSMRLGVDPDAGDDVLAAALCADVGVVILGPAGADLAASVVGAVRAATDAGALEGIEPAGWNKVLSSLAVAASPAERDGLIVTAASARTANGLIVGDLEDVTGPIDVDVSAWRTCVCLSYFLADRLVCHLGFRDPTR